LDELTLDTKTQPTTHTRAHTHTHTHWRNRNKTHTLRISKNNKHNVPLWLWIAKILQGRIRWVLELQTDHGRMRIAYQPSWPSFIIVVRQN